MTTLLSVCASGFLLAPIIVVILYNVFSHNYARRHFYLFAAAGVLWQIVSAIAAFYAMNQLNLKNYDFSVLWNIDGNAAFFSLSVVRLFLLLIIGLVSLISVLIAVKTIDTNRSSYTNLLMILMLGMNGMLLVNDLFSLYVFMEVVGICCFVMIAMFRTRVDLEGSFKYLVMSELASVLILTGLAFIFMKTGTLRYQDLTVLATTLQRGVFSDVLVQIAMILLISGFAIKSGVVPFHSWLPDAHQSADTAVSVLLSGVVIKIAGIYGLITINELFGDDAPVRIALATLGIVSIITGALLAARQKHFKRVVAYSSVSQMGYILLGLSTGSVLGIVGALFHVFSHAAFKSTLFVNAAALHEQVGSLELQDLGGLENQMPKTAFCSVIAFLSTAGIPPFSGFWSKLLILLALYKAGNGGLAGVALIASIFTGAYLLRLQHKVFFGQTRESLKDVKEIKGTVMHAQILLTILTAGVGLAAPLILIYLHSCGIL